MERAATERAAIAPPGARGGRRPARARSLPGRVFRSWRRGRSGSARWARVEADRGGGGDLLLIGDREVGLDLEAEHLRGDIGREAAHRHVEILHRLDVAVARDGDAVFGALQLRLQIAKVLVRLQLWI